MKGYSRVATTLYFCAVCIFAVPVATADMVRPADFIKLTALSERIVLIDVKGIKSKRLKLDKGIEWREVVIDASRIETLRGDDKGREFPHTSKEPRIIDMAKAKAEYHSNFISLLRQQPHQPSSCKVGHRYLVIFVDNMTIFYEVPKDSDKWRSQIQKYRERYKK